MKRLIDRLIMLGAAWCIVFPPLMAQANVIVDRSGTVTAANVSQQAVPASPSRTYLMCQNPIAAAGALYVNVDNPAATAASGSYELAPGGSVAWVSEFVPTGAVNVTSATTGARFICKAG